MSSDHRLSVRNLNVYYDQVHILQDVSFEIGHQAVAMIGRNGMGKSTLARALLGLQPARSGSVTFGGQEVLGRQPHQIVKAGMGHLPQGRRIWPSLSAYEHLVMVGAKPGSRWTSTPPTTCSRGWPTAGPSVGPISPAASSRCSPSPGRC